MKLRELEPRDAGLMLEWMHDADAVAHLGADFSAKTEADCRAFIEAAGKSTDALHLAIADDADTYMGTVSLKHIDPQRRDAEFAIAIRRCAMGRGYSRDAMEQILRRGFEALGLRRIWWCVSAENTRAVRFYDKNGYPRAAGEALDVRRYYTPAQISAYLWYCVEKN